MLCLWNWFHLKNIKQVRTFFFYWKFTSTFNVLIVWIELKKEKLMKILFFFIKNSWQVFANLESGLRFSRVTHMPKTIQKKCKQRTTDWFLDFFTI